MKTSTKRLAGIGMFTAILIVLQALPVKLGMFSVTLSLVPIIAAAALYGCKAGVWLGLVFGCVVLINDSAIFLAINAPGTVITVLAKGIAAALGASLIYCLLNRKNRYAAIICSAIAAPLINTGIFLLGCRLFFMDTISQWAAGAGFESVGAYMIIGLAGVNFLLELSVNIILSPAILRLTQIVNKGEKL